MENKEQRTIVVNFETRDYNKAMRELDSFQKRYKQLMTPGAVGGRLGKASRETRAMMLDAMRYNRNMLNRFNKQQKNVISRTTIRDILKHNKNPELKRMGDYYRALEKSSEREKIVSDRAKEKAIRDAQKAQDKVIKRLKDEAKIKNQIAAMEKKEAAAREIANKKAVAQWRKNNANIIRGRVDFLSGKVKNTELSRMGDYYKNLERTSAIEESNRQRIQREAERQKIANRRIAERQMRDLRARAEKSNKIKQRDEIARVNNTISRRNQLKKDGLRSMDAFRERINGLANVVTQAVGELTMFAGAITMVSYMAASAFGKMMKVGEAFANVEKTYLVGAGFRERLYKQGGVKDISEFDSALVKATKFTGKSTFQTAEMLARTGSTIKDAGGKVSMKNLMNVVESAYGLSAVTGAEPDKMIDKILKEAGKGSKGDTGKLGIKSLKLTKNMDANLETIARAVKENPIAATAIQTGSIEANINRIKSAPNELMSRVYGAHMNQTKKIFSNIDDTIFSVFSDPDVVKHWSKTLTNFQQDMDSVFQKDKIKKAAMDAAEWTAELSGIGKNILNGALWVLGHKNEIINGIKEIGKWWLAIQAFKITTTTIKLVYDATKIITAIGGLATAANTAAGVAGAATGAATLGASLTAVGAGLVALAGGIAAIWAGGKLGKFLGEKTVGLKNDYDTINNTLKREEGLKSVLSKYTQDGKLGLAEDYVIQSYINKNGFNFSGKANEFLDAKLAFSSNDPNKKQAGLNAMMKIIDEEIAARDKYSKENSAKNSAIMQSVLQNSVDTYMKNKQQQNTEHFSKTGYKPDNSYRFLAQSFLNPNQKVIVVQGDVNFSENVPYSDLELMHTAGGVTN